MRIRSVLIAATALSLSGLAACSSVDRDGSRDQFIELVESSGGTADADCVDDVLGNYSDDELLEMEKAAEGGETSDKIVAMITELQNCVTPGS